MKTSFSLLKRFKVLRGTVFDPFGYSAERRTERRLVEQYIADMSIALAHLNSENINWVLELAKLPEQIRGYGPVKLKSIDLAKQRRQDILLWLRLSDGKN